MAKYKSFNQYLDECQQMTDAVNGFERAVQKKYDNHGYPYVAGYMMMMFREAAMELPRKRREELKARLEREAKTFEQSALVDTIKGA